MSDTDGKHVFVSYIHEDLDQVDGLCAVLEAAQIPYWHDRKSLGPGDAWKVKIRQAIRNGSLNEVGLVARRTQGRAVACTGWSPSVCRPMQEWVAKYEQAINDRLDRIDDYLQKPQGRGERR